MVARRRALTATLAGGMCLLASGQGALALSAGLLARRIAGGAGESPWILAAAGVVATLVKTAGAVIAARAEARLSGEVGAEIRGEVASGLLAGGRDRGGAADVARVVLAVRAVERAVETGVLGTFRAALQLAPLACVMVALAPLAAVVGVGLLTPFAIVLSRLRQTVRSGEASALARAASLDEQVDELVRHVDLWRTFGSGARVRRALAVAAEQATKATAVARARKALLSGLNEVLASVALLGVVGLMAAGVLRIDASALVPFVAVFFLSYRPLRDLGDARVAARAGDAALASLATFRAPVVPDAAPAAAAPSWGGSSGPREALTLEAFGARRGDARVSTVIAPGEIVALTGPTGAGKTSLLRALLGLEPAVGEVRYGAASLLGVPVGVARPFAWVPQEAPVVAGTLDDNLSLAAEPGTGRARLDELAGAAFARALEGEVLGASGRPLSGGERAWVAVARAVATGQPVLLLDEPTASLDAASEQRFLGLLGRLRTHRSVVLVTHRPSTAAAADRVIALAP